MTESGPPPARGRGILPLAVLLAITAIVYTPSLSDEFVYDDHRFVPENEEIRDLGNFTRFFTDLRTMTETNDEEGWDDIYRPLRTLSFAVDWALFGDNALGYRLESLALHLLAVTLGWILLRRLFGPGPMPLLAAALFALHPLQIQTVAWVSSRGDVLAGVFLLGSALLLLRETLGPWRTVAAVLLFALALLSKENAIALIAVVVVYDWILAPHRRVRWGLLGALVTVAVLFVLVRFTLATAQIPWRPGALMGAGSSTVVMIGQALFPVRIIPYTGDVLFGSRMWIWPGGVAFAATAVVSAVLFLRGRRMPRLAFGFLWAVVCLAPVSNIVPLKSVAESRFAYLPLLGAGVLFGLVAAGSAWRRRLALVALGALALGTFGEGPSWRADIPYWQSAVDKEVDYRRDRGPGKPRGGDIALSNLGVAYATNDQVETALDWLHESAKIRETASTWITIAQAQWSLGDKVRAVQAAREALRRRNDARTREYLGSLLYDSERYAEAVEVLEPAVRMAPDSVITRAWFGGALLGVGRDQEARAHLETSALAEPDDFWILLRLGHARRRTGDPAGAVEAYERASLAATNDPRPLLLAGRAHLDRGDAAAATEVLARAQERYSTYAPVIAEMLAAHLIADGDLEPGEMARMLAAIDEMLAQGEAQPVAELLTRPAIWAREDYRLRSRLIKALWTLRALEEAERRLVEMRRTWPDEVEVTANLGMARLLLGHPAEAIPLLEEAAGRDSGAFQLQFELARAYRMTGREEDALKAAREASTRARTDEERTRARLFLSERRR